MHLEHQTPEAGNQVPDLPDCNLYLADAALVEGVRCEGAGGRESELETWGARLGRAELSGLAAEVNRQGPVLQAFDRRGLRIDQVAFHPGWSEFLSLAFAQGMQASAWTDPGPGAQVARAAHYLMHGQIEAGSLCPVTMTSAAIPLLAREPWFATIRPLLASREYDGRDVPLAGKRAMMIGMGMTERQGGSDLRANLSQAEPQGEGWFRLTGHKWFFSSPMSDAHLVLARDGDGHSCLHALVGWTTAAAIRCASCGSRTSWATDPTPAPRSNSRPRWGAGSAKPGRGIATLIEMASYTRLDCVLGSAALMRQALVQGIHHARHRRAFGRRLIDQPLMRQVLADLALESEAATALALRLAGAFDRLEQPAEQALRRVLTPAAKFWICKRAIDVTAECMEVWGGNGYVEDGPMARLYREAPVNSIWEGSGNVMCLDGAASRPPGTAVRRPDDRRLRPEASGRAGPADRRRPLAGGPGARRRGAAGPGPDGRPGSGAARPGGPAAAPCTGGTVAGLHGQSPGAAGGDVFGARPVAMASDALLQRAWPD